MHDETGSRGSGCEPQDIGDPFVSRQQWGHGMARATCVPSHGLGLRWYNAVMRAPTAGLTGLGTAWDVCTMGRGRRAEDTALQSAVIGSCPVHSGDDLTLVIWHSPVSF